MASIKTDSSLEDYQNFVNKVYGPNNHRHFTVDEMLTNIERFSMRGLKGIRKNNLEKIKLNTIIALSWTISLMNQFGVDLESSVWQRFPYLCSYCGSCPCVCKAQKVKKRLKVKPSSKSYPKSIHDMQAMFNEIYPTESRTLEQSGIHLAEEVGELSEAVLKFRGHHDDQSFEQIVFEASDLYSCFMGIFNSMNFDYSKTLAKLFSNGCHVCKKTPCVCKYDFVINFKS